MKTGSNDMTGGIFPKVANAWTHAENKTVCVISEHSAIQVRFIKKSWAVFKM